MNRARIFSNIVPVRAELLLLRDLANGAKDDITRSATSNLQERRSLFYRNTGISRNNHPSLHTGSR